MVYLRAVDHDIEALFRTLLLMFVSDNSQNGFTVVMPPGDLIVRKAFGLLIPK